MNEEDLEADAIFADIDSQDADNLFAAIDSESEPNQSVGSPAPRPETPRIEQPPLFGMRGPVVDTINDFTRKTVPFSHQIAGAWEGLTNPDDVPGDLSDRYAHYRDQSRQQEDQFAADNPKKAGLADVAGTTAQLIGTAGFGGAGVAGKLAKLKQLQAMGKAGKALAGAGGAGVTGAALTASKSRADTAGERLVDMAKGAGTTAVFGAAGALKPALTMAAGTGLGLVDAAQAHDAGDNRGVTSALTDTVMNLGGAAVGRSLAKKAPRAAEYQKRFNDARNQVTEKSFGDWLNAQQDLELNKGLLEANKGRTGSIVAKKAEVASERLMGDTVKRNTAFEKDVAKLAAAHSKKGQTLEKLKAKLQDSEEILNNDTATKAEKQRAQEAAANLRTRTKQAEKQLRILAEGIKAANGEAARKPSEATRLEFEAKQKEIDRQIADSDTAQAADPMQDPRVLSALGKVEAAQVAASDQTINNRVAQQEKAQFGNYINRANNVMALKNSPDIAPETKAKNAELFESAAQFQEAQARYLNNSKDAIDKALGADVDAETRALYAAELKAKAESDLAVARARLAKALEKESSRKLLSEGQREVLLAKSAANKAKWEDRQKDGSPERIERARRTGETKADPISAVPRAQANELLRSFGLAVPDGESIGTALSTRTAQDLRPHTPAPAAPSRAQTNISRVNKMIQDLEQDMMDGTSLSIDPYKALGPKLANKLLPQLARKHGLDPAEVGPGRWNSEYDFGDGGRRLIPLQSGDDTNPGRGQGLIPSAADQAGPRDVFKPGGGMPDDQDLTRLEIERFKLEDKNKRSEAAAMEAKANTEDVAALTQEPPAGQSWEDANFEGAPARAFRKQLEGSPGSGTSIQGNIAEAIRQWKTTGTANPLKIKAHQIAAKDPLAGAYFYEQMARSLRVPEATIRRNAAYVSAQGGKSGLRLVQVLDRLFEDASKNQPTP